MICENHIFYCNNIQALCKPSYRRTRHPPRRVLNLAYDGYRKCDRYYRCLGALQLTPECIRIRNEIAENKQSS